MRRGRGRGEPPATPSPPHWDEVFAGDASRDAYQRALRQHTALPWTVVESGHDDLLKLFVGKVPAPLGVSSILALSVLFAGHPKGDDAGRALLATVLTDLSPPRARMLLLTLEDAWHNAERDAFDHRATTLRAALQQGLRRLLASELPEAQREALGFIHDLIGKPEPGAG